MDIGLQGFRKVLEFRVKFFPGRLNKHYTVIHLQVVVSSPTISVVPDA